MYVLAVICPFDSQGVIHCRNGELPLNDELLDREEI